MSAAAMAQANAWIDYHQGYCFGKERGLLSRDAVLEAIRKVKGEEDRRGIGHRFFKGYTDALIDAAVWRPGRGIPPPWDDWKMPRNDPHQDG